MSVSESHFSTTVPGQWQPRVLHDRPFVGSPDTRFVSEDEDHPQTPHSRPRPHHAPTLPVQRPPLGHRSISSPTAIIPHRVMSAAQVRRSQRVEGMQEREWTLFGQRMENEGQLKTPEHRGIPRLSSTALRALGQGQNIPMSAAPSSRATANDNEDPFSMQSPVEGSTHETTYVATHAVPDSSGDALIADCDSDASEDSYTSDDSLKTIPEVAKSKWSLSRLPTIPTLYRNVLKCAVAYFIASLFTFVPSLSGLIADIASNGSGERLPSPAAHMVATVAVYFNPAKTAGGMVEADLFCLLGLAWAAFICLGSMAMFWPLELSPGWEWLADVFVLLWVGLGMTAVAWMKVWMAKPSFNTACSMTAIILFVVIVKEGGLDTLAQVSLIILLGAIVSNIVCYGMWPQSATDNLQDNVTKTLDSFSTLLSMLTNTFLLGDSSSLQQPSQGKLQRAIENHQSSFTSLKKNLIEARSEWMFGGPSKPGYGIRNTAGQAYEDAVDSLNRLAQHLNGLRSGTRLQHELTKAHRDGKIVLNRKAQRTLSTHVQREDRKGKAVDDGVKDVSEEDAMLQAAAVMFGELVDELSSPLNALSAVCTNTLKRLRETFVQRKHSHAKHKIDSHEFLKLGDDIERALYQFESTSNYAVMRVYTRSAFGLDFYSGLSSASTDDENDALVQAGDNETVFLVYFFIFTLQEFAKELSCLVDAMGRIYSIEHALATRRSRWKERAIRVVSHFAEKWRSSRESSYRDKTRKPPLKKRFSTFLLPKSGRSAVVFPKIRPHAPNTIQTPARSELSFIGRIKQSLWALSKRLNGRNIKYAFKAGMATAILAAPAFYDRTRSLFVHYKGEWALISFFVVISPTIGATNFMSLHRVLGTLLGAATAVAAFASFPENPVALSIFGFFFAIPCFYSIVATPQYATSGRFILLTYNLTCLYCYNLREKDVSVLDVAYHRSAAVIIGVVWAGLVSRFWWPAEARRELGNALSEFCLNIGWLYMHLVAANSRGAEAFLTPDSDGHDSDGDLEARGTGPSTASQGSTMLPKAVANARLSHSISTFMAMELHLQIKLIELQGLLSQTQHEPRLKGPFPVTLYRSILTSLQTILDKLHSMRCVTTREEWFTSVRSDFILPVDRERRDMVGNVILYFSVLSAAFKLKAPLPPYLPPAEKSRQRLVEAIRKLDVVKNRDVKGSRHLLFFAYALTMQGVCQELDFLGRTLQEAFGVIGQTTDEFEALFAPVGRSAGSTVQNGVSLEGRELSQ